MLFGPDGRNDGQLDLYVTSAVGSSVPDHGKLKLIAAPGTSEVLRYDGTTGAFLDTFVAPDSGGLSFPTFMTFTETDPTTLNYDGGGASAATAAVKPQATAGIPTLTVSGPSLPGGPLLASPPSGGARPGLAALPDSLWDRPSSVAPPSAASPVGPAAPVPPLVPSVVGDLPDEGHGADRSLTSRKSRSAADRLLAGLDIRQFLDPPAVVAGHGLAELNVIGSAGTGLADAAGRDAEAGRSAQVPIRPPGHPPLCRRIRHGTLEHNRLRHSPSRRPPSHAPAHHPQTTDPQPVPGIPRGTLPSLDHLQHHRHRRTQIHHLRLDGHRRPLARH